MVHAVHAGVRQNDGLCDGVVGHDSTRVLRWRSTAAGSTGSRRRVVRIPSERIYVAVLSNNSASRPGTVARQLAALAIGRPFTDPPLAVVPAPTLEEYVGTYEMADGAADQGRRPPGTG